MTKTKSYLLVSLISVLVLAVGVSVAYFSVQIQGTGKTLSVDSADLRVIFTDTSDAIEALDIRPGWSAAKTFTIESLTDDVFEYSIVIKDLVNTFVTEGFLQYQIVGEDGGISQDWKNVNKTSIPLKVGITPGIQLPVGAKHKYTINFRYQNSATVDQSIDMGKVFSGKIVVEAVDIWDGTTEEIIPNGNIYTVRTAEQLAWISDQVNTGANLFEGKTVVLDSNLDMGARYDSNGGVLSTSPAFTPIGANPNYFKGNFDGKNHTIRNLYINRTGNFVGLISINYGNSFKDLTVENSYIKSTDNVVGIIGGNKTDSPSLEIDNIKSINNIISGTSCIGGVIGQLYGNISNSFNSSIINSTGAQVGGIVGLLAAGNAINNINYGNVTSSGAAVGGIVGVLVGSARNNVNYATIKGETRQIGGIVGGNNSNKTTSIYAVQGNINYGNVLTANGANGVGGIAGYLNNGTIVYNNINYGDVDGYGNGSYTSATVAGGIAGNFYYYNNSGAINSYMYNNLNIGNVKTGADAGGIVGLFGRNGEITPPSGEVIVNSINEGIVEQVANSDYRVGGIVSELSGNRKADNLINKAYNSGTVKGKNVAGIAFSGIGIKNSYFVGTLEGTTNIYGVIGENTSGLTFSNVFYNNAYSSNYGTAIDVNNIDNSVLQSTLGEGFDFSNGVRLKKAIITTSGFEITSVTYSDEILE